MRELKTGVLKVGLGRYSQVFSEIIITAVIARLLSPEEFGIVASIMVFYSFAVIPIQLGLEPAVIRDKTLSNNELSGMFYLTGLVSLGMATLFFLGSHYILPIFYESNIYPEVSGYLAAAIVFNGLDTVPRAVMLKGKRFGTLGMIQLIINIVTGMGAIYLASRGYSYKALIIRQLTVTISQLVLHMIFGEMKLSIAPNLAGYRKNNRYSRNQLYFSSINYFSRNLDNILIGRYLGMGSLGYYDKAYKLMLYPVQNLTSVVVPVLHPVLSSVGKMERILSEYIKVVKILTMAGFAITAFSYHTSFEIVELFYGKGWTDTGEVFKVLSLIVGVQVVLSSSGAIFQATGRTDYLLKAGIFSFCTNIAAIVTGVSSGELNVIGYCLVVSFTINFIQCYYLMMKIFDKNLRYFIGEIYPGFIYGMGIFIILWIIPSIDSSILIRFLYKSGISLGVFLCIYSIEGKRYGKTVEG